MIVSSFFLHSIETRALRGERLSLLYCRFTSFRCIQSKSFYFIHEDICIVVQLLLLLICVFFQLHSIRTGSTWAQEMVWLLGNNLDYEGAKSIQTLRSPLLEMTAIMYEDYTEWVE